uniref:Uncharacterized protein n=1 Tax=Chenopodium quinoa TaxID=63459 RepID=A0A803L9B7_CHEQI
MEEGTIFITIFSLTMKSSIAIMILLLPLSSSIEAHIKASVWQSDPTPQLFLDEYMGKVEAHVSEAINSATQELAGKAKGSNTPITLHSCREKESLRKILIRGEYNEYPDDMNMHCKARLAEMLRGFSELMHSKKKDETTLGIFLTVEIQVLEEAKGIGLPNFLPHLAFITLFIAEGSEGNITKFMTKFWGYVEGAVLSIIMCSILTITHIFRAPAEELQLI